MRIKCLAVLFFSIQIIPAYAQKNKNHATNTRPVSGKYVFINQSKIYYVEKGVGTPVLFVSGLGDDHETWKEVQDSISGTCLSLSYDRSGLGKSGYHQEKKDLVSIANELHRLIIVAKFPKPFIIIGHSLGCLIVKYYASAFPSQIKAIIFIDPGYNEELLKTRVSDSLWQEREKALKMYLPVFNEAQTQELKYCNRSAAMSDSIKTLPQVPITLFTATFTNPEFPCSAEELVVKKNTHDLWLKSMPTAVHKFVPQSRHYIQNDAPGLIIQEIRGLLAKNK